MKHIFIVLLIWLGYIVPLSAQRTFEASGRFDGPYANKMVWVSLSAMGSTCNVTDSVLTDSTGHYTVTMTIDTITCPYGYIYIRTLDCRGDTLRASQWYYYHVSRLDSVTTDFFYCDTCSYLNAGFTTNIASQWVGFNNTSTYWPTYKYTWDFGDGSPRTYYGGASHDYAALGSYTACMYMEDTVGGCRDTFCATVNITQKNRPDSILIKGHVNNGYTSGTAWVDFDGYPSGCSTGGSTSITSGLFEYWLPMSTCYFGQITTKMLDCDGDTLINIQYYDTTRSSDTFYVNFDYCDSCKDFRVDFNYTVSGDTVTFTSYVDSSANSFYWEFDFYNSSITSTDRNPVHVYPNYGFYSVKLTAWDSVKGCMDSIRMQVFISSPSQLKDIWGMVYTDSAVVADTFKVWLITVQVDSVLNDTILTAVDSLIGQGGFFHFTSVSNGVYLIKASLLPSASNYSSRIPTYYSASTQWNSATPITVTAPVSNVYITLITGSNPGGSGFIGGYVSVGANKTGDPIESVQVLLFTAAGTPVAFTYTDANGEYKFSNLAFGIYKVVVEVPGKSCEEFEVTIDANNPTATNKSFEVNTKDIKKSSTATGITKTERAALGIYPNPATTSVTLQFDAEVGGDAIISITDIAGRVLVANSYTVVGGNNATVLNIESLNNGVYFVVVKTQALSYTSRLSICK